MARVLREKVLSGYNGNLKTLYVTDSRGDFVKHTNGVFVTVERKMAPVEQEGEAVVAHLTTETDFDKEIYLVDTPVVIYDENRHVRLEDFVNEGVSRGFSLNTGDYIGLTEDLLPTDVTVGDVLVAGADGKLQKFDEATHTNAKIKFYVFQDLGNAISLKHKAFSLELERQ